MSDVLGDEIKRLAEAWSVDATNGMLDQVSRYLRILLMWNRTINLTGAVTLEELVGDHLPDSFALARLAPTGSDLVDVGSGGGLPAIPFAVLRPDCHVTLVEPRAKRVAFLNAAKREIACGSLEVVRGRIDDVENCGFKMASSRATFSPEEWLSLSRRLLVHDGRCVVFAAAPVDGGAASASVVEELEYRTRKGSPRWFGVFCFT